MNKKPNRKFSKSKKPQSRNKRLDKFDKDRDVRCSDVVNDASYYMGSDSTELSTGLNTYSFDSFMGIPTKMGKVGIWDVEIQPGNIMTLYLNPSASYVREGFESSAGINLAGLKLFTYLSANNAKTTNYAPQDTTLLLLAVGNILTNFSYGARALGLTTYYNKRNRSMPEMLMNACGFSVADISAHKAEYRNRYNYLIARFNKIPIPADIKYFRKSSELYHGIYLDEENSSMAQTYVLSPYHYWIYDETTNPNGTILKDVNFKNSTTTTERFRIQANFNDFLDDLESQIDALLTSATLNYLYSDILRVHQKENMNILTLNELPADYAVLPAKVDEISEWINNATILGWPSTNPIQVPGGPTTYTKSNDVESDVNLNAVIYRPQFNTPSTGYAVNVNYVLNFKHDNPSLEDRIIATRLHSNIKTDAAGSPPVYASTDAALTDYYVVSVNMSSGFGLDSVYTISNWLTTTSDVALIAPIASKFDWHPMWYYHNTSTPTVVKTIGDLQYFTTLDFDTLFRIQEVAFMEEIRVV